MDFEKDIEQCLTVLKNGGTILYPTDTVWGIGCDATNAVAVEKIFQIKKRPDSKAMIVLVADEREVLKHVASVDLQVFDYLQKIKKPTTVIYEHAIGLADNLLADDGSIGIRICNEAFCRHLIKRFRRPIVSTSANISGDATPPFFAAINDEIKKSVDYVVKHRQDDQTIANPSSVIKWDNGTISVIRP
ncbi:L-threonylcarbamoyladenylate synthase [Terrimonas pollutisoli]|uniref:L-threonylcarbamoyladenylate synthase n=1 Tax=Terrimonas pollutisoli TaxID=3034147 RepID=UPI0023EB50AD|nr:L-threonylcarbamoyladenylate synthase [Terrimonas sp. H1YJ31]